MLLKRKYSKMEKESEPYLISGSYKVKKESFLDKIDQKQH